MGNTPEKMDPLLRARRVRLLPAPQQASLPITAAGTAVALLGGVSRGSLRRWRAQAELYDGTARRHQ